MTSVDLTAKQVAAAHLVADDKLSDQQIADSVGVTRDTVSRWKRLPEFKREVEEHFSAWREKVMSSGIADKVNRIASYDEIFDKLHQVIAERASELDGLCAGGSTGLMVRTVKFVKVLELKTNTPRSFDEIPDDEFTPTRQMQPVEEFAVDTGMLAELRNVKLQAARELGQLVEKHEVETRDTTTRESLKRKLVSVATTVGAGEVP